MNITRENTDELNAVMKVSIEKADYEEKTETVLKDYRKKVTIKELRRISEQIVKFLSIFILFCGYWYFVCFYNYKKIKNC